jgi:hypothetical protein
VRPGRVLAAVAVLAVAAFVAVALLTRAPDTSPAPTTPAATPADPAPLVELVPAVATSVAPGPAPAAAEQDWAQVELAVRPAGLGPDLAAPVSDGLDALRDTMDACFAAERAHPHRPSARAQAAHGPAVLVLRLEATAPGHLAVAGTDVETLGFSPRELVDCCREAAKGYELPVPGVESGRRFRVKMLLQ